MNAPGLTNRLQALLKQYFPQALVLCGEDLWRPLATRFPAEVAQPAGGAESQNSDAQTVLLSARLPQRRSCIEQRLALIDKAVPVTDELAVIESFVLRVQLLARELQLVQKTITEFDRQIAAGLRGASRPGDLRQPARRRAGVGAAAVGQPGFAAGTFRRAPPTCNITPAWRR